MKARFGRNALRALPFLLVVMFLTDSHSLVAFSQGHGDRRGPEGDREPVAYSCAMSGDKKKDPVLLTVRPTPKESPFFTGAYLITVFAGKKAGEVPHSAVAINGTVYSWEGEGMVEYPNVGAYLNKRKFEDGRDVRVNPIPRVNMKAMLAYIDNIKKENKKYDLQRNNCTMVAADIIEAGGKSLIRSGGGTDKADILQKRNEDAGNLGEGKPITEKQIE